MKVKELIEQLNKLDENLEVVCYSEDVNILPENHGIRLLDIVEVDVIEAEKKRGDDQIPSFNLGNTAASTKHAIIEVITEF